jgi:hypothetical protein
MKINGIIDKPTFLNNFMLRERHEDNIRRAEELKLSLDDGRPVSFYRLPENEARKGKELANAVASDREFLEKLEATERGTKRSDCLRTYLYMENLVNTKNHLTVMSLGVCMYFLKTKYGVDIGRDMENSSWAQIAKELCP